MASQSYRNPTTYFPGLSVGTLTVSITAGLSARHAASHGGGKEYLPQGWTGGLSQREQSLPGVSGHGSQWPEEQFPGVVHPSNCSPTLQPHLKSAGL